MVLEYSSTMVCHRTSVGTRVLVFQVVFEIMFIFVRYSSSTRVQIYHIMVQYLKNNLKYNTVVLLKTKQNVDFSPYLFQPLMEQSVFNRF
jgi:hypothetical protein